MGGVYCEDCDIAATTTDEDAATGVRTYATDTDAAARELASRLAPGDVVLVKGPRAAGLERVAAAVLGGDAR